MYACVLLALLTWNSAHLAVVVEPLLVGHVPPPQHLGRLQGDGLALLRLPLQPTHFANLPSFILGAPCSIARR